MTLDEQILETIQTIGGIFATKNIPSAPINLDYLEEKVAPGQENLVVAQLIMHLEDLFSEYLQEERKVHKFSRYVDHFTSILDGNSDGGKLIGKTKKRTA